jgi:NADH-quinone oxidoreductase subunit G
VLGRTLPFDNLTQLRKALYAAHPHLAMLDSVQAADPAAIATLAKGRGTIGKAPITETITDFYLTNPIARASAVMAECSSLARGTLAMAAE